MHKKQETFRNLKTETDNLGKKIEEQQKYVLQLTSNIAKHKRMAQEFGKASDIASWKIKGAEFIALSEQMSQQKQYKKMETIKATFEEIGSVAIEEERLNNLTKKKDSLIVEKELLQSNIKELKTMNEQKNNELMEIEQENLVLKNRNIALLRRISRQQEEVENQTQNLTTKLSILERKIKELCDEDTI